MGGAKRPGKKPASKPRKIPPPASRGPGAWGAGKRLVEPGPIALSPEVHRTFACVQYHHAVQQWEPLVPPGLELAKVSIEWDRIEDVVHRLGPLPDELIAAWAIGNEGRPVPGDYFEAESFAPEAAVMATGRAFDAWHAEPPEGFIALRSTGTRDEYEALLNAAVGYEARGLPQIGFVQFDGYTSSFQVHGEKPITEWLVEWLAGELSLDVPAAFIDAFEVVVD
jgi:hypothetical protein